MLSVPEVLEVVVTHIRLKWALLWLPSTSQLIQKRLPFPCLLKFLGKLSPHTTSEFESG